MPTTIAMMSVQALQHDRLNGVVTGPTIAPGLVLFVCTQNSARSKFAAALWQRRTGREADSAGSHPAPRVHPGAVRAAAEFDLGLGLATPKGYESVDQPPDLVVSVCDRAHESGLPFSAPNLHWSVPDPANAGTGSAFRAAFADNVVVCGTPTARTKNRCRHLVYQ